MTVNQVSETTVLGYFKKCDWVPVYSKFCLINLSTTECLIVSFEQNNKFITLNKISPYPGLLIQKTPANDSIEEDLMCSYNIVKVFSFFHFGQQFIPGTL